MSDPRSPVHAANTTAWKPLDFLSLQHSAGQGFSETALRSQIEPGFRRARIEAMPDSSLSAPPRWSPPAHETAAGTGETTPPPAQPTPGHAPVTAPLDEQQAEAVRAQAFEEGLAQGRREGEAAAEVRLLAQLEAAQAQGLQDLRDLLVQVGQAVAALREQPDTLHAPLKRLALHLAEELVLGELSLGASAIDRLVQRCIDAVDAQGAEQLTVELHPDDLAMLQQHPDAEADRPRSWSWHANPSLLPGSVRVRMNEAVVSDLIEHRLQALAKQLLGPTQTWAAGTAFNPARLAERRRQDHPIEDALPRMGGTPEPALDERLPAWAMPVADTPSPGPQGGVPQAAPTDLEADLGTPPEPLSENGEDGQGNKDEGHA